MSNELPDGVLKERRKGYSELKKELHTFFRKIWIVVIVIGATSTLGLVGYGVILREIQNQRHQFCVDQNTRHDNTEAALVDAAQEDQDNAPTEAVRKEIRRRRDVTLGLIDALAPKQNCNEIAPERGFLP